jgi:hypothetical protein
MNDTLTLIRELIDADDDFSLSQHPLLDVYLAGGSGKGSFSSEIAFLGSVVGPRSNIRYNNPTFEQYAVICGKQKALLVFLEKNKVWNSDSS